MSHWMGVAILNSGHVVIIHDRSINGIVCSATIKKKRIVTCEEELLRKMNSFWLTVICVGAVFVLMPSSVYARSPAEQIVYSNVTQQGKQYVGFNLYMNFLDFIEHCHKNGMQPADVLSGEENQILTAYLDGNFAEPKYFWLGGSDIGREGRYYWIASLVEFSYTSWGSGYPNGGVEENCATIYGGDGTWYDQYCTNDGVQPLCQRFV